VRTAELEHARAQLGDVQIRPAKASPRSATEAELDDLAYLCGSRPIVNAEIGPS